MIGPAMSDTYDEDIVLWSEHQAELLRQHAAAARANDAIDWPNIIEEIESVGNEQRFAVESNLSRRCCICSKPRRGRVCATSRTGRPRRAGSAITRRAGSRPPCASA